MQSYALPPNSAFLSFVFVSQKHESPVAVFFLLMQHQKRQRREAAWAYRLSKAIRGHEIKFLIHAPQLHAVCTVAEEQGLFLKTTWGWSVKSWYHGISFMEKALHDQNRINQSGDVPGLTKGLKNPGGNEAFLRFPLALNQWQMGVGQFPAHSTALYVASTHGVCWVLLNTLRLAGFFGLFVFFFFLDWWAFCLFTSYCQIRTEKYWKTMRGCNII